MKRPVVNVEEKIGKVVGTNVSGTVDYDRLVDAAKDHAEIVVSERGVSV